jgi:hypothetical protein
LKKRPEERKTGKDIPFLVHPSNPRNRKRSESPRIPQKLGKLNGSQGTSHQGIGQKPDDWKEEEVKREES